jgi:peptidase C25-like protein
VWTEQRRLSMARRQIVDVAEQLAREATESANAAIALAIEAQQATGPARRAFGSGDGAAATSGQKVAAAAAAVQEGAAKVAQAAFALDLKVKLTRSTNVFRWWQQCPAWLIAGGGLGLAFYAVSKGFDSAGTWTSVTLILILAVVAMFRGPADLSLGGRTPEGTGGDGGGSGSENSVRSEARHDDRSTPAGTGPPATGGTPILAGAQAEPPPSENWDGADDVSPDAVPPVVRPHGGAGMRIMAMGLRYPSRARLVEPLAEDEFGERIERSLAANIGRLRTLTQRTRAARAFRGERPHTPSLNLTNPRLAGWTYLLNAEDPRRTDIERIMAPLAERRGAGASTPLLYDGATDPRRWIEQHYGSLGTNAPRYVLIVGGPQEIPFSFQPILDLAAMVGRVHFEDLADLESYVSKVIRLEEAKDAITSPEALFFAPDYGMDALGDADPTYYSRRYMVAPLAARAQPDWAVTPKLLEEGGATKSGLAETLRDSKASLIYTASHGIGAITEDLATQKRLNGAICCQSDGTEARDEDWLFTADDVPTDRDTPFLEGAIFFQFACFGYGTPAQSDFAHWDIGYPEQNAPEDFIAALPSRLLAHPRGPIGYIGHLDTAWLHGFVDPEDPEASELLAERFNPRLAPFRTAIDVLLAQGQTAGMALEHMNLRFSEYNATLTRYQDQLERRTLTDTPKFRAQLADDFISRGDAQNYMILGDPAVSLRISSPDQ